MYESHPLDLQYSSEHDTQFSPKEKIPYLPYSYLQLEMNIYNNCRHQDPSQTDRKFHSLQSFLQA
jgi:proteasome lid subunit RPN8/RPN11